MSSVGRRVRVVLGCTLCVLFSRSDLFAQQPLAGAAEPPGAASQPAPSRPASTYSSLAANIKNVQIIAADLRQTFERGQATAASADSSHPDNRMALMAILVTQKLPYMVNKRVEDDAAREAIQADLKAAGDYIDNVLVPAYQKARDSRDPADAKALVPLLDGLTTRVTRADETARRLAGPDASVGMDVRPASPGSIVRPGPSAPPSGAAPAPAVPARLMAIPTEAQRTAAGPTRATVGAGPSLSASRPALR